MTSSHPMATPTTVSRVTTDEKDLKSRKDLYRRSPSEMSRREETW